MEWTPDLSVGVGRIDDQHKQLFERINKLVEAVKKSECKYVIGDVIKFLYDYAVEHFGDEEALMLKFDYPSYGEHKAEHEKFVADLLKMEDELKNETSSYARSVYTNQIVVDWIINHIKEEDIRFGDHIKPRLGEVG